MLFIIPFLKIVLTCAQGYKYNDGETVKNITCGQTEWIYPEGWTKDNFPECKRKHYHKVHVFNLCCINVSNLREVTWCKVLKACAI